VEVIPEEVGSKENSAQSPTMQASMQCVLDRLYAIFSESRKAGWDGYGARAASYESYLEAKRFIEALPASCPAPEIALDPDGEVSLEWYSLPGKIFSVSVGADGELTYAGKFGPIRKTHGTEPFSGEVPTVILANLRRVLG